MKSSNEIIVDFTEFVKRVYEEHIPKHSTGSSTGDYIKRLKQQLELIESEISSEKTRLLDAVSSETDINIDRLSDVFFNIIEEQHTKWMDEHMPWECRT